jgi:hypothetical protein
MLKKSGCKNAPLGDDFLSIQDGQTKTTLQGGFFQIRQKV